jgi:hypothetical protein
MGFMGDIHEAARAPKPRGEDSRPAKRPWIPPFFIFPTGSLDAVLQKTTTFISDGHVASVHYGPTS